ncbi:trypsin-like peptidase domain-containing protein [Candidatus Sumerlaeota bacterium]|nr:trypsin-like peptidase domain-containing protein [Candidatus Sumerlaeota bacterium]
MSRKWVIFIVLVTAVNIGIMLAIIFLSQNQGNGISLGLESSAQAARQDKNNDIRRSAVVEAAEKVSPAVVTIGAVRTAYARRFDPFFSDFFSPFIVYPYKERLPYLGSGFIINSKGYILTNYHVIEGAEKVLITLADGRELEGEILDADRVVDVAMLKIREGEEFPSAQMGNSDDILIGETVLAIGNPFGNLLEDPHPSVTAGVVSAVKRSFNPDTESLRVYSDMIQTDASINPGNSGGPLVNIKGEVIGINTFIMSRTGASHGIGFAIPINRARAIAREIIDHGRIRPLWRDFDCVNLTPYLVKLLKANDAQGVVIRRMEKDGPAQKSGLQVGDIIRKANGRDVRNCADFIAYFSALQVGDAFSLEIFREGKILKIDYIIHEYKS